MNEMRIYRSLPNDFVAAMKIVWDWRSKREKESFGHFFTNDGKRGDCLRYNLNGCICPFPMMVLGTVLGMFIRADGKPQIWSILDIYRYVGEDGYMEMEIDICFPLV